MEQELELQQLLVQLMEELELSTLELQLVPEDFTEVPDIVLQPLLLILVLPLDELYIVLDFDLPVVFERLFFPF